MNWLIKKEIRLLLPAWIAAMLLAVVPSLILPLDSAGSLIQVLFSLGVLILGITSFGQEFNFGAISNLLAQPLDRHRIWRTKTMTLALAFLIVCLAAFASILCRFDATSGIAGVTRPYFWTEFRLDTLGGLALSAIVTFSGGLWTTLLVRQMTGAFWFTLLIPAAIAMVITAALQVSILSESSVNTIIIAVLMVYSIAGFFFARRLFLRAQDTQWTGGQIALFSRKESSESIAIPAIRRPRHWFSSLFWKEIQLHQANLLIAVLLLALNIASVCILKIHPRFNNPDITYMLEGVGILWLLMPLVIGSAAVSEERRLGILESHLCLPTTRRAQLSIKFIVALGLSLFLGGAMPLLMDHSDNLQFWIFAVAAAIFFVSFYASSFARSTVQALGLAIAIWVMIGALLYLESTPVELLMYFPMTTFGLQILTLYLASAILLLLFIVLIFWNFNWLHEYGKTWRHNVISVLVAVAGIFVLSTGIYFRAWELFLPPQPPPGPTRISNPSQLRLANHFNALYVVTPDGRLWTETFGYDNFNYHNDDWIVLSREKSRNEFIGGTNWVDVTADDFQAVGIQSDGTLWSLQRKWNERESRWRQTGSFTLAKIGSDRDWSQVAGDWNGFLFLKKDGSLWTWGTHNYESNHERTIPKKLKLDRLEMPVHINDREAYAAVFSSQRQACVRKNDGTVWRWTAWNDTNYVCTFIHDTNLDSNWSNFSVRSADDQYSLLGVKTNGGLFLVKNFKLARVRDESQNQKLQLGQNADWKTVAFGHYSKIWAIRADGTLWQWAAPWQLLDDARAKPAQLGSRSDWIALTGNSTGEALAADGSLWAWDQPSRHIWLAPSRRPVYMGNIFEGTDAPYRP